MRKLGFVLLLVSVLLGRIAIAQDGPPSTEPTPALNEEEIAKDSSTEINVKNADIGAIVRIFSRKTKRNYILDERVKGKVSIFLPGKISAEESIGILDSVLAYKGFTAVPIGENLWKIVPSKEARQSTIPTVIEDRPGEPSKSMVTRLVQLSYVNADDVRQLISQLISPDGFINGYTGTNSLVIIDNEDNIQRLVEIIKNLDVPSSDQDMTIIPIKYADAVDIATKLNELLGDGAGKTGDSTLDLLRARVSEAAFGSMRSSTAAAPATGTTGGAPAGGTAAGAGSGGTVQQRAKHPKIIADERTNSVIVVADEDTTARVRALISQLDTRLDLSGNRYYVYRCQHASADELAEVLSGLAGGGGSTGSSTSRTDRDGPDLISGGGFGSNSNRTRNSNQTRTNERNQSQTRTPGRSRNEGRNSNTGVKSASLGEDISITADPATNSLIIQASKTDYLKILELLKELDIKRRQVLVEAILLEVNLEELNRTSTSFITSGGGDDGAVIAQSNGSNIASLLSNPAAIQDFSIAAASAGTLTIGGGDNAFKIPTQSILLTAAKTNANINVLSAPTILTTDNEQAEIVVGQNVPFLASTATSDENLNNTFNQIDRQDVGITLRLTPQISSGDTVTLKLFTEVSSIFSSDPRLGPTTNVRTSETSVITKDSQMVVIGGLMADARNDSESGVPYLKDVPVLGHLFRTTREEVKRTNLLILITPRIVKNQFDARDLTIEARDDMKEEIREQEVYPSREEVLDSMDIDRVSESKPFAGEPPTTILAPEPKKPEVAQNSSNEEAVLEFKVDPKIPNIEEHAPKAKFLGSSKKEPAQVSKDSPREEEEVIERSIPVEVNSNKTQKINSVGNFIVLKALNSKKAPPGLPFQMSEQEGLVGLIIPEDASPKARQFFQVGTKYSYQNGSRELPLSPVGVFATAEEAKEFFPGLRSSWYTLSPYEIMSLGDKPWQKN